MITLSILSAFAILLVFSRRRPVNPDESDDWDEM